MERRKPIPKVYPPRHRYKVGSVVMRTDGISYVKTHPKGWVAQHRHVMELEMSRDLNKNEKVFHLDNALKGEPEFNDPKNLVVIKCRTTKWVKLSSTRLLYEPAKEKSLSKKFKEYSSK